MRGKRSSSEAVGRPKPSRLANSRCVSNPIVRWKRRNAAQNAAFHYACVFRCTPFPDNIEFTRPELRETLKRLQRKRLVVADTSKVEDKLERKKLKRAARKKAAPKAKRTEPRGAKKKKVKKLARGQSKR